MLPPTLLPSSPATMTISGRTRFICVHQPDASVVYPRSPRARKNDMPAVRARPRTPTESLLSGPPKSPAAANVKCVADSSFQRGWEKSKGLFTTAPFWNKAQPAAMAMTSARARTATALRRRMAASRRLLGIRRGSLAPSSADTCLGIRSVFGRSRAFIQFNDFLSSSNNSLSESDFTRTVHGPSSAGCRCCTGAFHTWSVGMPTPRNFRVVRVKAFVFPRKWNGPMRRPWFVAAIPFMRSGVVGDRSYQSLAPNCGQSGPECNTYWASCTTQVF